LEKTIEKMASDWIARQLNSPSEASPFVHVEAPALDRRAAPFLLRAAAYERQSIACMAQNVDVENLDQVAIGRWIESQLPGSVRGMFRSSKSLIGQTVCKLQEESWARSLSAEKLVEHVSIAVWNANVQCQAELKGQDSEGVAQVLYDQEECHLMHEIADSNGNASKYWGEWWPTVTPNLTVQELLHRLPGISATQLPEVVNAYESPERTTALPGAISLHRHDVLHIALHRGLLDQDEAFVIGATMGSNRADLSDSHVKSMIQAFSRAYPEPYRVSQEKLQAYMIGVELFSTMAIPNLNELPLERLVQLTPKELRRTLSIDTDRLVRAYQEEVARIPNSLESYRIKRVVDERLLDL
jgi:hypothetical protein